MSIQEFKMMPLFQNLMELNNFNEVVDLLNNPNENKDNELSLYLHQYFKLH